LLIIWEGSAVETEATVSYRRFRFPAEVIAHAVWLYHRFPLSFREVEELLLARGIIIRTWCNRFSPQYAAALRRRRPQAGDKWHLDEVFVKINGMRHYLWRAVDQDGNVLDILVQSKRDAKAAKRFLAKLMKKQCRVPRVLITDKLRSYGAAHSVCVSPSSPSAAIRCYTEVLRIGRLLWLERSNLRVAIAVAHGYLVASGLEAKLTQSGVTALANELKKPQSTAASVAAVLHEWQTA
jgi:transposase-like protein